MTSTEIKKVALKHFARDGYEGASLAYIAEEVGIKKQSIYTHFNGKDELFMQVCRDVFLEQVSFVVEYLKDHRSRPLESLLHQLLIQYKERYERDASTRFWLRTSFFPPGHLYDDVIQIVYETLDKLEELLLPLIRTAQQEGEISRNVDPHQAAAAYMGVLDSVLVEMLYGGPERLNKRLDATWLFYWRGLSR